MPRYEDTMRFAQELRRLLGSRSARAAAKRIGREHSTVSGWLKGRTVPAETDDIARIARALDGDAVVLQALAEHDRSVYTIQKMKISPAQKAGMIRKLEKSLSGFLNARRRPASGSNSSGK